MSYCEKCNQAIATPMPSCPHCGEPLVLTEQPAMPPQSDHSFDDEAQEPEFDSATLLKSSEKSTIYVDKQQKYDDFKSSASAFFIVGTAIILIMILSFTGVLSLPMTGVSRIIFHFVFCVMGIFCFVTCLTNWKEAKLTFPQIAQEQTHTLEMIQWFTSHYDAAYIDDTISVDHDQISPELQSLKRLELIEELLTTQKDLPDPAYTQMLTEVIYNHLYEDAIT